jgi:hypothetical protein
MKTKTAQRADKYAAMSELELLRAIDHATNLERQWARTKTALMRALDEKRKGK